MASAPGAVIDPFDESNRSEPQAAEALQAESIPAPVVGSTAVSTAESTKRSLDVWMLAGVLIAVAGTVAGIKSTGVNLGYFFQPAGVLIVLGGTFGIALITTPRISLRHSASRCKRHAA